MRNSMVLGRLWLKLSRQRKNKMQKPMVHHRDNFPEGFLERLEEFALRACAFLLYHWFAQLTYPNCCIPLATVLQKSTICHPGKEPLPQVLTCETVPGCAALGENLQVGGMRSTGMYSTLKSMAKSLRFGSVSTLHLLLILSVSKTYPHGTMKLCIELSRLLIKELLAYKIGSLHQHIICPHCVSSQLRYILVPLLCFIKSYSV